MEAFASTGALNGVPQYMQNAISLVFCSPQPGHFTEVIFG